MYQKEIKESNENIIFNSIFFTEQSFSIPDLTKRTNMTFPTIKRVINEFLEKNIIIEWNLSSGGIGRRAVKYKFNPDFCYSIGVSIDEKELKFILMNSVGTILLSDKVKIENEDFLVFLIESIKKFISKADEKYIKKIIGIGISIPGIYNKENNFLEFYADVRYSTDILKDIGDEVGYPVWAENEANMSILAEAIIGKYKELSDFTVITINNKVTCSTFHKFGDKSEEYFFKASRVHYMVVDYENQKKVGDLISFKVLKNSILENFPEITDIEEFFSNKKYRYSAKGKNIVNDYLTYMGIILKNLIFTYNPKKLIVCGELSKYSNYLLEQIVRIVYPKDHIFYRGKETLTFSKFKGNSSIVGAALFPIVDKMM